MANETIFYDIGLPFEACKIITTSILGEPRLTFTTDKMLGNIAVAHKKEKEIYRVKMDELNRFSIDDLSYGDKLHETSKMMDDLSEMSKLFYNYGNLSLKRLAAIIIGSNNENEELFVGNNNLYYEQLSTAMELILNNYYITLGVMTKNIENEDFREQYKLDNDIVLINPVILSYRLKKHYMEFIRDHSYKVEFGDALAQMYVGMYCILFGIVCRLISNSIIDPSTIFTNNKDISDVNIGKFLDIFLGDTQMDYEGKRRFVGMIIAFYKLTTFYNYYTCINIDDPVCSILSTIGENFDNNDNSDFQEFIDRTLLTQEDLRNSYKIYLEAYLEPSNAFITPYNYIDSLPSHDNPNKFSVASAILHNGITDELVNYTGNGKELNNPLLKILEAESDDKYKEEGLILSNYNFILTELMSKIPNKCSPRYFHILINFAGSLRYILSKSGIKNSLSSKDLLNNIYVGLWYLDGLITYLFHEWFRNSKFYHVLNVWTADKKAFSLQFKAESYCISDLKVYANLCILLNQDKFSINKDRQNMFKIDSIRSLSEEYAFQQPFASFTLCNENKKTIFNSSRNTDTYYTRGDTLYPITHLEGLVPVEAYIKYATGRGWVDDDTPIDHVVIHEMLRNIIFNLVSEDILPSIIIYSRFGMSNASGGIASIKTTIENLDNEKIYQIIRDMDETGSKVPMLIDKSFSVKIASNVDKLIEKGTLDNDEQINLYLKLFFKTLMFVGMAKELLYDQIDKPEYVESIAEDNVERVSEDINYDNMIPHIEIHKKFNFLSKR